MNGNLESANQPLEKTVKPKAISHVAVVHCNFGQTDALVVFYAEGNIDRRSVARKCSAKNTTRVRNDSPLEQKSK